MEVFVRFRQQMRSMPFSDFELLMLVSRNLPLNPCRASLNRTEKIRRYIPVIETGDQKRLELLKSALTGVKRHVFSDISHIL